MRYYLEWTDTNLLPLIKKGDVRAFQELYERHWSVMSDTIFRITKTSSDTQDIIQEIFISIWRRREVIEIKGPVIAYLLRAAKNLSLRFVEQNISKGNFLETLTHFTQEIPPSQLSELEIDELERTINLAIEELPSKMREVFLLSRIENLPYKEIAERLSIAETTVKKQVSNALKLIRKNIQSNDNDLIVFYALLFFSKNI